MSPRGIPRGIPPKCDVCGREWNTKMQFYPDGVACVHDGPCRHPEGETCQYYYANGHCALRFV